MLLTYELIMRQEYGELQAQSFFASFAGTPLSSATGRGPLHANGVGMSVEATALY